MKAKINFIANGIIKSAGQEISEDELSVLGNLAGGLVEGFSGSEEVSVEIPLEAPKEQASIDNETEQHHAHNGKKKKKGH